MQKQQKEQIVTLISDWRDRSNLSIKQIVARIQAEGCDINRAKFENRFIRYDQTPAIAPELTLAVIAAFTKGLTRHERCTAAEAIDLAKLTHLPIDRFAEINHYFPNEEFQQAFSRYVQIGTPAPIGAPAPANITANGNGAIVTAVSSPNGTTPPTLSPPPPIPLHFPGKTHQRLIGRSTELDQLLESLREPDRKPLIAVIGLGGMGKTTLVQEAMDICWQERLFEHIVWTSAKTERFVGEGVYKTEVSDVTFEQLLDEIGRQCDRRDIPKLPFEQKKPAVKHLLMTQRVLVVLDNLETVAESEAVVDELFQLLGQSKLLITSRHQLRHERTFTLDLGGLFEAEGLTFLREDSEERGIDLVTEASQEALLEMYNVTGGAPLAMKLVIGQVSRWPLERVLSNLRAAKFAGPNYDFYRFIFKHSWDMLSIEAKQTLVSMAVFDLANGCTETSLGPVCNLPPDILQLALDHLILLSLVDTFGDLTARRYTLHSLTHYFILSDIVKKWS